MEKHPDTPEQEPYPLTCGSCDEDYIATKTNSKLFLFVKQPECTYMITQCPHCSIRLKLFLSQGTVDQLSKSDIGIEANQYADDDTYEQWLEVFNIDLIKEKTLTPRQEDVVRKFGSSITSVIDNAPELFWDHMESPKT